MPNGQDQRGRSKSKSRFVMITEHMARCPAWKALSPSAVKVYIAICFRYYGNNNGQIGFSVRDGAEELGMAPGTVHKALDQLQSMGFIKCHMKGSFNYKKLHSSEWEITDFALRDGKTPTREFTKWRPPKQKKPVS